MMIENRIYIICHLKYKGFKYHVYFNFVNFVHETVSIG